MYGCKLLSLLAALVVFPVFAPDVVLPAEAPLVPGADPPDVLLLGPPVLPEYVWLCPILAQRYTGLESLPEYDAEPDAPDVVPEKPCVWLDKLCVWLLTVCVWSEVVCV